MSQRVSRLPHLQKDVPLRSLFRALLVATLAISCGGPLDHDSLYEDLAGTSRLRLVAANLTTGNNQNYNAGEGLRILEGLRPDVVMVQEFNYNSNTTQDFQNFANAVCGSACYVTRETGSLLASA